MEFNFDLMVDDAYQNLNDNDKNDLLVLPKMDIEISMSRLHWKNVKQYLQVINRHPDHFMNYLKNELNSKDINWYSNSKSDGLIIHGKSQKKNEITSIAISYINNYVICSSCKKSNSLLTKNDKYLEFQCLDCGMKKFY